MDVKKKMQIIVGATARKNRPPVQLCKMTAQDSVPIYAIHEAENIIETYPGLYTKMYRLGENNYQTETEETQQHLFLQYRSIYNSLGTNCEFAITVCNRDINMDEFCELALFKETGDEFDYLRRQYNQIITDRMNTGHNGLIKNKYLTVGIHTNSVKKAAEVFTQRLDESINAQFTKIGSSAKVVSLDQRLEVLHDIYNIDDQGTFLTKTKIRGISSEFEGKESQAQEISSFDLENIRGMGLSVQDVIGPSSFVVNKDHLRFGRKFACVMRVDNYPSSLSDEFFLKVTDVPFHLVSTINVQPISAAEANKIVSQNIMLARNEKVEERKALIQADLPEDMISMDTEEKVTKAEELRTDMVENDEKLYKTIHTITIWADTKEELKEYRETVVSIAQTHAVGLHVMEELQEEGFNATLPLLYNDFPKNIKRTLKSSTLACASMPFSAIEINDPGGINYSMNQKTKNLILFNRLKNANYNSFILGSSGSGKSFSAKTEMLNVLLRTNADCIVIDPESEYGAIATLLDGETIKIVPGGKWHINPLEIPARYEYGDKDDSNPILAKAEFILRLIEKMLNTPYGLSPIQRTIIDECVHALYAPFIKNGKLQKIPKDQMPTLTDLQLAFAQRKEPEARELAIALRLYTGNGSLNVFGYQSNVDVDNRFVVYDIRDVGDTLKPIAMLIILDSFQNRLIYNQNRGRNTWFWVDECHLLFQDEATSHMLTALWKRARKYGGVPTGITQNLADMLKSTDCCTLLQNCSFIQILNQAQPDREGLRDLLNLSDSQLDVIRSAPRGQGLIYTGKNCIGFSAQFPKDNDIFRVLDSSMENLARYRREIAQNNKTA